MSERDLKLQVIFSMMEKVTAPLKRITGESTASGKALKALRDRLKDLDSQQKNISGFRQMHTGLRETAGRLDAARERVKMLADKMKEIEQPTRTMTREFDRATKAARLIKEQHQRESQQLQVLRDKLHSAGISTQNLGQQERALRSNIEQTNVQITQQQRKLAELAKRHEQVIAAKKRMHQTQSAAGGMAAAGVGMTIAGGGMGVPVIKSIDQAAQFQQQTSRLRALGIGEDMVQEGVKFAKGMDIMGSSSLDNLKLLTEAQSILRDFHHAKEVTPLLAKMKFGIEGVMQQRGNGEGHGEAAEMMFRDLIKTAELRGALKDMDTFKRVLDFSTKAYVASGGLVKPEDLLNMIKTGGVAAKQLSDDSFFFGMLHNIQEMGGDRTGTALMSAYQNWAVGRTTQQTAEELHKDGLVNPDSIKYGKTGHITKMMPDALQSAEKYKSDPFLYLIQDVLPKIKKEGMTDNQVVSKITTLFSSRTAANLMSSMYLERANIEKHRIAAKGAFGIDQLNKESSEGVNGKYLALAAKRNTLEQQLGEQLLPIVNSGLELLINTLSKVNGFFSRHQTVAKVMMISFASLAAVLVAMGGLTLVVASLIGPFAILRFSLSLLGMRAAGTATRVGLLSRAWQWLGGVMSRAGSIAGRAGAALRSFAIMEKLAPVLRMGASAWQWLLVAISRAGTMLGSVGTWFRSLNILSKLAPLARVGGSALLWLGRAALMLSRVFVFTPWGAIIAAIGTAAYLIYDNWSELSPFFARLWDSIKETFNQSMMWFSSLKSRLGDIGMNLMEGLVNGIIAGANMVEKTINTVADNVIGWFKEKLGIHSPSVVFTELGQFTMEGLANGVANNQQQPLDRITSLTERMTQIAGGLALATTLPAFAVQQNASLPLPVAITAPALKTQLPPPLTNGIQTSAENTVPELRMPSPQPLANAIQMSKAFTAPMLKTQSPNPLVNAIEMPKINAAPIQPTSLTPLSFDRRPPVSAAGNQTMAQAPQSSPIQIIINPAPGMDPQAIANAVAAELDKRERQKAVRQRSAMHDYDNF